MSIDTHNTRELRGRVRGYNATPVNARSRAFSVYGDSERGTINRETALAQSALGISPYAEIRIAAQGAIHDYIYNHTPGPPWLKGLNADIGAYNFGPNETLSWDGALTIFELLSYEADQGHEVDFKSDPINSQDTINRIIDKAGILPEHVWNFVTNLDRIARERGTPDLLRPSLKRVMKELPSNEWMFYLALGLGTLVAIRYVFGPIGNANR